MADASALYCPRCLTTFHDARERCPNLSCGQAEPGGGWGVLHAPGALFDRHFRVTRHLAVGGGGLTYLARALGAGDAEEGPEVAIKVLFAGRDQGGWVKRLATEAEILRELDHPNIVEYRGFVARAGHPPYLITRYEPGGNLADHVRRVGPLPIPVVARIGRQVCWGLALAHLRGVIHRDLKPENILLAEAVQAHEAPHVRVADFGIAKVQSTLGAQTRQGAFVGTPAYAAPEQLMGAGPTPATDMYGLGAVLYFCATGGVILQPDEDQTWEEVHAALLQHLPAQVRAPLLPGGDLDALDRLNRLLAALTAPDPAERATAEIADSLLAALIAGREPGEVGADEAGPAGETLAWQLDQARESSGARPATSGWSVQQWRPPDHPERSAAPPPAPAAPAAPVSSAAAPPPRGPTSSTRTVLIGVGVALVGLGALGLMLTLALAWWAL